MHSTVENNVLKASTELLKPREGELKRLGNLGYKWVQSPPTPIHLAKHLDTSDLFVLG